MSLPIALGTAPCCICDPQLCTTDDTGQHCADRSCGRCLHGWPQERPGPAYGFQAERRDTRPAQPSAMRWAPHPYPVQGREG